jgi:hypothetical protein
METVYEAGATFFLETVPLSLPEVHGSFKDNCIYLLRQGKNKKQKD